MAIDPSIALNVKPLQLSNPLEQFTQFQQAQGAVNQNRLADLVYGEKQREVSEGNLLNQMYKNAVGADGALDRNKLLGSVAAGGLGSRLPGLQKSFQELDKGKAEISKTQAEAQAKQVDALTKVNGLIGSAAGAIVQNPTYDNATQIVANLRQQFGPEMSKQFGLDALQIPQDPTQLKAWAEGHYRSSIDSEKQLADARAAFEGNANRQNQVLTTKMNNDTSRANNAATVAATVRGQNLTDARARDTLAQGKTPVGYRQGPGGTLVAIPGGPADPVNKPPTEFQGKSAAFGARAEQADKILTDLAGKYSPTGINVKASLANTWGVGGALGAGTNLALSDSTQRAEQAQRDFINAVLRQESGAAIAESEFDNARKQYFPQPGDSAAVISQKAANRKLSVQGLKTNAGRAAFSAPTAPAATGVPDDIAALLQKHGGK